jgi:hypothetical protein
MREVVKGGAKICVLENNEEMDSKKELQYYDHMTRLTIMPLEPSTTVLENELEYDIVKSRILLAFFIGS